MMDLQVADKENVSLVHKLKTKKLKLWLNRIPKISRKGMWIDETPKVAMDVVEKKTNSLMRANKSWNIPLNSLSNHLNGKKKI
jgi:hypothetical protein